MSKVITCLWFGKDAEEAAGIYTALLPNSRIDSVNRAPTDYPGGVAGDVLTVYFTLDGQQFLGLNGGERVDYGHAASVVVMCDDQAEVDRLWSALIDGGGKPVMCGWLNDRFGVPWQITPRRLVELITGPDRAVAKRVTEAMMQMVKLDIAELERAAQG
jgi:predicted 3-demethylubiquinone-9 3-methyltransferase (glyoxalase superfamily)